MAEKVVTRFAPSPTGYLHIGGARTALFNWLLARKTGGKFILRIEDTDRRRNTPTATEQVISDLRWLGIGWDEGPQVDGPNGPYFQSQRKENYDKYIKKLLGEQKAYYCFETAEQLEALRKQAEVQKTGFIYQRPDVFPDEKDVQKAKDQGKPITVRFAMPEGTIQVDDLVRGTVSFNTAELGDFIIQKSDGFPTYNFACVVDDKLMGITHIIRGQEHLTNTPGQQALWEALGFGQLPKYAHMSVTVSDSGGKLSKRERPKALRQALKSAETIDLERIARAGGITAKELGSFIEGKATPDMPVIEAMAKYLNIELPEINVVDFLRSGYLPETMVNFMALLGWNPGDGREIMSVDELIDSFDISRLTKTNSLFDRGKLLAFNTEHIRRAGDAKLLGYFREYLKAVDSIMADAGQDKLAQILKINAGARTLAQIEHKSRFIFLAGGEIEYDDKAVRKVLLKDNGLAILQVVRDKIGAIEPFTEEAVEKMLREMAAEKKLGLGKVAQPVRVALCGTTISPPIFDSVVMLGRDETVARIDIALKKFAAGT